MSVKLYSNHSLPDKYRQQILQSGFCKRNSNFIPNDWIEFQLSRAPYNIVALDDWNVCGFLIGFDFDKSDPRNSEVEKSHDVWWLDTICRNSDKKYYAVTRWLIDRFISEAAKHGATKIRLYATTPESTKAYLKYGFVQVGSVQEDGGALVQIDLV